MNPDLFITNPLPQGGGYTWTLASRFGKILEEAQDKYGGRDKDYTILGFEFVKSNPQIWYPGNCKNIVIQLGIECMDDLPKAMFQLAHECIHVLSPTLNRGASILEEGLASYFSKKYVVDNFQVELNTNIEKYNKARELVQKLIDFNPDCIKNIRSICPKIKDITTDDLLRFVPQFARQDAEELVKIF